METTPFTAETDRRRFLRVGLAGLGGLTVFGWANGSPLRAEDGNRKTTTAGSQEPWTRGKATACILVWLGGGPSQLETWDPKPDHENGGPTESIRTAADFRIAASFPKLAGEARDICLIRSMTSREGEHGRASYLLHTGYKRSGALTHPSLGALVAKELGKEDSELPHFVSVGGNAYGPGFLGVRHGAFQIGNPSKPVPYLQYPDGVDRDRFGQRMGLLGVLDDGFLEDKAGEYLSGHRMVRQKAIALLDSPSASVFEVRKEPDEIRAPFGKNSFGLSALMACRLVEKGVPFVEIHLGGWDTHSNNFNAVANRASTLDPALSALLKMLRGKGLLDTTLVVCMGEFGRTPRINRNNGRDHYPRCFSVLLAGGGVNGGTVVGSSSKSGMEVGDRPVQVPDLYATLLSALRINPVKENKTAIGRSIKASDAGDVIGEVFL